MSGELFDMTAIAASGVTETSPAGAAVLRREKVMRQTQAAEDAVLAPEKPGAWSASVRAAFAVRIARLNGNDELAEHYADRITDDTASPLADPANDGSQQGLAAVVAFMDKVAAHTREVRAEDIEALSFNKAVAKIYELANAVEKAAPSASRNAAIRALALLVAPMMPHLAEEAWAAIGNTSLVAAAAWPQVDAALLQDESVTIAIQHKGKLRDTLTAPKGASKEALEEMALASEKVQRSLDGAEIRKVIVVPDRLVNIVT